MAKNWILHDDNAPTHAALSEAQFLTSECNTVMPQPPYSHDLAPYASFQECYKQWQHRSERCMQAQGTYFESDHIVVDE
jgi:hypothetical protein